MNKTAQVLVVVWLVIGTFVGYLITDLVSSRQSAEQRIRDQAVSYARLVEQHASAAFERAYIGILGVEDHLRPTDLIGADRLSDARRKEIEALLMSQQKRTAGIISMSVSDADGNVFANSVATSSNLYLGDREYFQTLKRQPRSTPVISEAVLGRGTKEWGIHIVRRLDLPNGSFGGMLGASLGLTENFADFYATLSLGKNSTVSLRDAKNRLLVRYPFIDEKMSKQILTPGLTGQISGGNIDGVIRAVSTLDNVERLYGFRKLTDYPIYAVVGLSLDDALSGWRRERDAAVVGALLVIFAGAFITIALLQRKRAEAKLAQASYRNQLLLRTASDGIHVLDAEGNVLEVSDAFCTMLGYTRDELLGMNVSQWDVQWSAQEVNQVIGRLKQVTAAPTIFEAKHKRRDGRVIDVEISSIGVVLDGKPVLYCSARDVTERKQMEDQVRELVFYDSLTKLPNRRLLNDRLSQTMAASKRSGCYGALMFLDLDNFKPLNDTHGHVVGDLLLIEAADRLKRCVREMDTVARFGGDEFVVILSDLNADKAESTSQAEIVAEKIRTILSEPYLLTISQDGKKDATVEHHHCTASIGVIVFINHEGSQDDILKWADTAMYEAKEAGRNLIRFYDSVY